MRAELTAHAPFLSEWMADGIASAIANEATERAIVRGEVESFPERSIERFTKTARKRDRRSVDLFEVSGVEVGKEAAPREAEAMAIVAFLRKHHETAFPDIVVQLGTNEPAQGREVPRRGGRAAPSLRPRRTRGDRAGPPQGARVPQALSVLPAGSSSSHREPGRRGDGRAPSYRPCSRRRRGARSRDRCLPSPGRWPRLVASRRGTGPREEPRRDRQRGCRAAAASTTGRAKEASCAGTTTMPCETRFP